MVEAGWCGLWRCNARPTAFSDHAAAQLKIWWGKFRSDAAFEHIVPLLGQYRS